MPPIITQHAVTPISSQPAPMAGTIPLSTLIEFIVQRTYHELTVLSELLPQKTDLERKIEIMQFASRTRQLFIRLLALVKWTSSANKVDKCAKISSFLDQQQQLFIETADMLARMARETLVHARLPCFSLPCAVDVLTTGSYPRLPACIKEKILPPSPITAVEKKHTLDRLSQIIEHRIVTTDLPQHMCQPHIGNGRVRFRVEHEFEVTLTLMGDGPNIPWRLLDIDILVEDPEIGEGQTLVHSLQVSYIHQLVQSRLVDSDQPLDDLYRCLHSFCQSLQLEVLFSQTQNLIRQRLGDHIRVEEYAVGKCLSLSYWRKDSRTFQPVFKLSIHVNESDSSKPLQITHFPQILGSESTKVAKTITSEYLSVEKILIHSIQVRSLAKLKDLERELRLILTATCEVKDVPLVLYVPLLNPCQNNEKLCITVDLMKGVFLVSLELQETGLTREIEECLNSDRRDMFKLFHNLRCWLMLERCRKSLQFHMVTCFNQLPITNMSGHALESLSKHRLYARLPKQPEYFLVIEIHDANPDKKRKQLDYRYHLLQVSMESVDTDMDLVTANIDGYDAAKKYLRAGSMVQLDTFLSTHGQSGRLYDVESDGASSRKRKMPGDDVVVGDALTKKPIVASFIPQLTHIVALCEDRLPLIALTAELDKRGIPHQGIQVDGEGVGLSVGLLQALPCPESMSANGAKSLTSALLSFTFRIQRTGQLIVEVVFGKSPLLSNNCHEQGLRHRLLITREKLHLETLGKTLDTILLDEWNSVCHLYDCVYEFAQKHEANTAVDVKSYNFKTLTLAYGPSKSYTVSVTYGKRFRLVFGCIGETNNVAENCHTMVASYLEKEFNQTRSLFILAKTLCETWAILGAIARLPINPVTYLKKHVLTPTFSVIPQSATHLRIIYRSMYCIDIQCVSNNLVQIRDGVYSVFETNKVIDSLSPIQNLQSFLNLFVDDTVMSSQVRRRSTTEDDNPPSPVDVDAIDGLMSQPSTSRRDVMSSQYPANVLVPSPSNVGLHVQSPSSFAPAPSPGSLGIHMPSPAPGTFISPQGVVEGGSPFPNANMLMPSPGQARTWPASPSMPGPSPSRSMVPSPGHGSLAKDSDLKSLPSRMLPQRTWAASVPTPLSHDAFCKLLNPVSVNGQQPCCPLERFLASVWLRRHLLRIMQSADNVSNLLGSEAGVVMFKVDCGLHCRISLNLTQAMQSLCLKVIPPQTEYGSSSTQWDAEELQLIEVFFESKVVCVPFKPNCLVAFIHTLKAPYRILKDFVQIMRMELFPDCKLPWRLSWCLTVPLSLNNDQLIGSSGVVIQQRKIVLMIQFTRNSMQQQLGAGGSTTDLSPFVVPILYTTDTNTTQMMLDQKAPMSPTFVAVNNLLKRFNELNSKLTECSIYPAIRELLTNLAV